LSNSEIATLASRQKIIDTSTKPSEVSIVKCKNYDQTQVNKAVKISIENIGGLGQFVGHGTRVHIKPNLLTAKSPDKGATTHPKVVRAIVKQVMELGGIVTIGDSPAGISRPIEEFWQKTGMED